VSSAFQPPFFISAFQRLNFQLCSPINFSTVTTIFRLTLPALLPPPTVTLHIAGNALVIAWPASATGYSLMSATSLTSPGGWSTVTNTPVVVNGFDTVTNVISGQQMFYYLAK
jgi:hypothetical protein